MMAYVQAWLLKLGWERKILLYAGSLSLVPVRAFSFGQGPDVPAAGKNAPPPVDTMR